MIPDYFGMNAFTRFALIRTAGFALIMLAFISCDKGNLPPVAKLVAFPPAGDTSVMFEFNAGGSEDDRDFAIALEYRWDFDGDGIWETGYSKISGIAHKYRVSGIYNVTVGVKDLDGFTATASDSIEVYAYNMDIDTLVDPRDGNRYRIVKIKERWWMAENLRYGIEIQTDQEQTDNNTVEFYRNHTSKRYDTVGGVYLWYESMKYRRENPQGVCPDGWHIPTQTEWESLFSPLIGDSMTYVRRHLKDIQYYRKNGPSNLNLDLNNAANRWEDRSIWWDYNGGVTGFWSSDSRWNPECWKYDPYACWFNSDWLSLGYGYWSSCRLAQTAWTSHDSYLSVRCIKDN